LGGAYGGGGGGGGAGTARLTSNINLAGTGVVKIMWGASASFPDNAGL
jgi:hypothetical protein